jgi:alanine racemase
MPRPLVATIDIAALRHNLNVAQQHAPNAKTWAVVKANAYGHGLARGMRGFAQADGLALVEIEGAAQLRQLGWQKRILLVEGFLMPAICSRWQSTCWTSSCIASSNSTCWSGQSYPAS